MGLTRISITIARDLLGEADRRARSLGRSRSWVLVEALRAYLRSPQAHGGGRVQESEPPAYAAREVAEARTRRLVKELALSPGERLRRAAELLALAPRSRRRHREQVIAFDSYEDFHEWKKARRAGGW